MDEIMRYSEETFESIKHVNEYDQEYWCYAKFQNYGYMGLYGGLTAQDIHDRKGLKEKELNSR